MANRLLRLLICSSLLLHSIALAAGSTMNFRVWVQGGCSFVDQSDLTMNFGSLSQGDRSISAKTAVFCTNGTHYQVKLSKGLHAVGEQRQMAQKGGNGRIPYSLTASPSSGTSTGTIFDIQLTASVKEADHQNQPIGVYSDTVVLTIDP